MQQDLKCKCGLEAKILQSSKANEKQGWYFAACPRPREEQCRFFKWIGPTLQGQQPSPGRKRTRPTEEEEEEAEHEPGWSAPFTQQTRRTHSPSYGGGGGGSASNSPSRFTPHHPPAAAVATAPDYYPSSIQHQVLAILDKHNELLRKELSVMAEMIASLTKAQQDMYHLLLKQQETTTESITPQ